MLRLLCLVASVAAIQASVIRFEQNEAIWNKIKKEPKVNDDENTCGYQVSILFCVRKVYMYMHPVKNNFEKKKN